MKSEAIVSLTKHASFREIGEEGVILMTDSGQLYSTNASGTAFMRRLGDDQTVGAILDAILEEFDVEREVLTRDIADLVAFLAEEGVVSVADAS